MSPGGVGSLFLFAKRAGPCPEDRVYGVTNLKLRCNASDLKDLTQRVTNAAGPVDCVLQFVDGCSYPLRIGAQAKARAEVGAFHLFSTEAFRSSMDESWLADDRIPLGSQPAEEPAAAAAAGSTLEAMERRHILHVLRETGGVIGGPGGAAARLGLKRTTLNSRLKKLGIGPAAYGRYCERR